MQTNPSFANKDSLTASSKSKSAPPAGAFSAALSESLHSSSAESGSSSQGSGFGKRNRTANAESKPSPSDSTATSGQANPLPAAAAQTVTLTSWSFTPFVLGNIANGQADPAAATGSVPLNDVPASTAPDGTATTGNWRSAGVAPETAGTFAGPAAAGLSNVFGPTAFRPDDESVDGNAAADGASTPFAALPNDPAQGNELSGTGSGSAASAIDPSAGSPVTPATSVSLDPASLDADAVAVGAVISNAVMPGAAVPGAGMQDAGSKDAGIQATARVTLDASQKTSAGADVPAAKDVRVVPVAVSNTALPTVDLKTAAALNGDVARVNASNNNSATDAFAPRVAGKRGKADSAGVSPADDSVAHTAKSSLAAPDIDSTKSDNVKIGKSFADTLLNDGSAGDQNTKPADPASVAPPLPAAQMIATAINAQATPVYQTTQTTQPAQIASSAATTPGATSTDTAARIQDAVTQLQAAPTAAEAHGTVNTSKLIQTMGETEMRVGMRSSEFGDISIRTSSTRDSIFAQISLEHADLAKSVAAHIPEMQARLGGNGGFEVNVSAGNRSAQTGSSLSDSGSGSQGRGQQDQDGRSSSSSSSHLSGKDFAATSMLNTGIPHTVQNAGQSNRLDLQA